MVLFEVKIFNEFFFDRFFDVNFATLLATSWAGSKNVTLGNSSFNNFDKLGARGIVIDNPNAGIGIFEGNIINGTRIGLQILRGHRFQISTNTFVTCLFGIFIGQKADRIKIGPNVFENCKVPVINLSPTSSQD